MSKKIKDGTYDEKGNLVKITKGYQVAVKTEGMSTNKETRLLNKVKPKQIFIGVYKGQKERSFTITNKAEAIKIAKKHNQHSIWDNKKGKEIIVDGTKKKC